MKQVGFDPAWPWLTGDLQTIRNAVVHNLFKRPVPAVQSERIELPTAGGADRLVGALSEGVEGWPLAVLVHGLTGCSESIYLRRTGQELSQAGYPVLRLNLRGAGAAAATCDDCYHAGRSEDLNAALDGMARDRPDLISAGVFLVGFSLGGNMLMRFLAVEPNARMVRAAATVSSPLDLMSTSQRFMRPRNRLYHRWLLARMKQDMAKIALNDGERTALREARTVYEFDDRFVAPRFGFDGAPDYYARCSGGQFLAQVRTPTLLIHAQDDPWISIEDYHAAPRLESRYLTLLAPSGGGHVGFHRRRQSRTFHDDAILAFFAEALSRNHQERVN
ncbi:MAG: alpha/beta fold hydrolase [Alphaproteobacteria bacterium]|nr:alpha/beta fold hydrolase [Alphaproteobacteria bacterium]